MDLVTARAHALELMKTHGLVRKGWTFEFDRAKYRLGLSDETRKQITISKYFTDAATKDEFEQAMLHEIAHALLPAEAKHGMAWKMKAHEIGYRGKRLAANPYGRQRRKEEAEKFVVTVKRLQKEASLAGSENTHSEKIPVVGDILALPNGRRIKVVQSNRQRTKAVEIDGTGDREWIISTSVAYNLIERAES